MSLVASVVLPRANVTLPDGVLYTRARFTFRDGIGRLFDSNGNLLASAEGATLDQASTREFTLSREGATWAIEKAKCGCGGG